MGLQTYNDGILNIQCGHGVVSKQCLHLTHQILLQSPMHESK